MTYSHKGKRNLLIWDGTDDGISSIYHETNCPKCGSKEKYQLRNVKEISQLPDEITKYLLQIKIVSFGSSGYEIKKGFPAYIVEKTCENCHQLIFIVIGFRETQPQRYNIYFKSNVYIESGQ